MKAIHVQKLAPLIQVLTPPLMRPTLLVLSALLSLGGCAMGPDFRAPDAPAAANANSYTPTPIPAQTDASSGSAGVTQRFDDRQDIPAQWWSLFHSIALDQMIQSALQQSPTMASAQAALRQAQESFNAQSGNLLYPSVDARLAGTRQRASAASTGLPGGSVYNLVNASVNVSYTLDVFGASRRTLEGLQSAVDYQHFQVEATYLTLTTNLVTTAIKEASLRAQLQATREILDAQQHQLAVIEKQLGLGAIPRLALLTQRNQVAQTQASLPGIEKALGQTRHQLSVYAGKLPSEAGMPEFQLDSLQLPQDLPLTLPSALVRQRPDVRASEALLHEASAAIGVATANQYPQISLSGSYGSSATRGGDLFSPGASIWSLAAGLTQPIFNGGALSAKRRAAVAGYDQAEAQYRATVLTAFQNVADSLRALDSDASTLKAQAEVEALAHETLNLTTSQYALGAVGYLAVLDAERTYQQSRIGLVQAQAARYADTAALFQALGGGWWNRQAAAEVAPTASAYSKN
jgi:NodT family efflux transporter outer membrane factor (OMF) lipoprotein